MLGNKRQAGVDELEIEVKITPAMIRAGREVLEDIDAPLSEFAVSEAFRAMMRVALADRVYLTPSKRNAATRR